MLGVFDAEAPVPRAVVFGGLVIEVKDAQVGLVADGMNHHLQARPVCPFDAFEHDAFGNHLLEKQPTGVGRIIIRLE